MKKILCALIFVFAVSLVFALVSCGEKEDKADGGTTEEDTTQGPTTAAPTEPPPTTDPGPKKKMKEIELADSSNEGERNPVKVGEGGGHQSIGVKFTADFRITDMDLSCPSWSDDIGTMVFKLYKWDTDYEKTVAGTPVFVDAETFVDYPDNAMMSVEFSKDGLEPGTYYWELSEGTAGVGVWAYRTHGSEGLEFFKNGAPFTDGTAFIGTIYGFVLE